jgi:hypothetical protein
VFFFKDNLFLVNKTVKLITFSFRSRIHKGKKKPFAKNANALLNDKSELAGSILKSFYFVGSFANSGKGPDATFGL